MIKIEKPFCFANIKQHTCNNWTCKSCFFHDECCNEIKNGRGIIKLNRKKNSRDFDKIKVNGKVIEL